MPLGSDCPWIRSFIDSICMDRDERVLDRDLVLDLLPSDSGYGRVYEFKIDKCVMVAIQTNLHD